MTPRHSCCAGRRVLFSFTPSPLALLCLKGNSSHKEVVKQLSGKVLGVFWRSKGEGKGEGRRWEPLMEGQWRVESSEEDLSAEAEKVFHSNIKG